MSTWRKAALIPPLLFCLWLLVDEDSQEHDLAVWTALARHPPSLRVYRALLELTLLLFCASLSLFMWKRAMGARVVGILLFQPPQKFAPIRGLYQPVATTASTMDDDNVLTEEEAQDAYYDSDGEVQEETTVYAEPPTAAAVANAALDLLLLVLVSLFLFTISSAEGGKYIDGMQDSTFQAVARIAAPVFPLVLFVLAAFKSFFPFASRKDFWLVVSFTVGAPCYDVTFRDGFIGDILTSSVRPMQDLAFTVFYIFSGLRGWWTQAYNLDDATLPLETSWLLHTVVLPACMVSPLWWRFLQNLRQTYDHRQRWPYLGNALKYFVAAQVSMLGLFDPSKKQNALWILGFVGATLYQIWWDVFMDWELIEFSSSGRVRLRSSRLYPYRGMYWSILVVNCVLRFCWTLSFLPQSYLDQSGMLLKTFDGRFTSAIGPAIASLELVRRMLWGFLRVELEALKSCRDDAVVQEQLRICSSSPPQQQEEVVELSPIKQPPPSIFRLAEQKQSSFASMELNSDMSARTDIQILAEVCFWATAFAVFAFLAGAHRATF